MKKKVKGENDNIGNDPKNLNNNENNNDNDNQNNDEGNGDDEIL